MTTTPYPQPTGPQDVYGQQPGYGYNAAPAKSKTVAAMLAFFLGSIGVHSFYRGQTKRGIGHIALAVISVIVLVIGFANFASNVDATGYISDHHAAQAGLLMMLGYLCMAVNGIWAFVEFIMILMSKDGSLR